MVRRIASLKGGLADRWVAQPLDDAWIVDTNPPGPPGSASVVNGEILLDGTDASYGARAYRSFTFPAGTLVRLTFDLVGLAANTRVGATASGTEYAPNVQHNPGTGIKIEWLADGTEQFFRFNRLNAGVATIRNLKLATRTVTQAAFGAKTIATKGGAMGRDAQNQPLTLTGYQSLVTGSLGTHTPVVANGRLHFTTAGAPDGAVLRCTHAGGTVDLKISTVANAYSVASLAEADAAYEAAVLGDEILMRQGGYNLDGAVREIIGKGTAPTGTWTGSNYVTVKPHTGDTVTVGRWEINAGGVAATSQYLRITGIDFMSELIHDVNGLPGVLTVIGSDIKIDGNTFDHVGGVTAGTTGHGILVNCSTGGNRIHVENNTLRGGMFGIKGVLTTGRIVDNDIRKITADAMQITKFNGGLIQGNVITEKLYGHKNTPILSITPSGANTIVEVADISPFQLGEFFAFSGLGGAAGMDLLNNKLLYISGSDAQANTLTFAINTSGEPAYTGGGTLGYVTGAHGDYIQFSDAFTGTEHDNVTIRGNLLYHGEVSADDLLWPDGQGIFMGGASRSGWTIEGNIYCGKMVRGISVPTLVNSNVRSNTVIRGLGANGAVGGSNPSIFIGGDNTTNVIHNIACAYSLTGTVVTSNNPVLSLVANNAVPANATDLATMAAAFVGGAPAPGTAYDPITVYAPKTGGPFDTASVPGAIPAYNFATDVYTQPPPLAPTSLYDFAANTPVASGMTAGPTAITDGWQVTTGNAGSKYIVWDLQAVIQSGKTYTIECTVELDNITNPVKLRVTLAQTPTSIRGLDVDVTPTAINTPKAFTNNTAVTTVDSNYLAFYFASVSGVRIMKVTKMKIYEA